jgi:hypothetical protein
MNLNEMNPTNLTDEQLEEQLEELLRREARERMLKSREAYENNDPDEILRRQERDLMLAKREEWFDRFDVIDEAINEAKRRMENGEFLVVNCPKYTIKIKKYMKLRDENRVQNSIFSDFFEKIIFEELRNHGSHHSLWYDYNKFKNGYISFNKNHNNYMYSKIHWIIIKKIFYNRRLIQQNNLGHDITEVDLLVKYFSLYNYPWWFFYKVGGTKYPLLYETLF